jgi:hypothetical protein
MIHVTVQRKFADGAPSLSVSPRRGFRTEGRALSAALRLLVDEAQQPDHEWVGEYVVTFRWGTGRVQRDYYRPSTELGLEYVGSDSGGDNPHHTVEGSRSKPAERAP